MSLGIGSCHKIQTATTAKDHVGHLTRKKGRTAQKTYQKGNIALMRRIHQQNQDDEVAMEDFNRAQQNAPQYMNGPTNMYSGYGPSAYNPSMPMYAGGPASLYSAPQGPGSVYSGQGAESEYSAAQ